MKRKLFLAVIMVLVLCLTCGMLLVACDKDDPVDPTPPPPATTDPVEMNFTEAWNEVTTALANNAEYSLAIEIRNNEEEVAPIFGLAIEYLDGEYVLYGAVNSNVYMKFNGFDLTSLLNQIGALVGMNDLVNLLQGLVANMVFANTTVDVYGGNVYDLTVTQNTGEIISQLSSLIEGFIPSEEIKNTINSVINTLSGFLGFELADGTAVTDLTTLLSYVGELIATHDISIVIGTGEAVTNDESDPFGGVISGITPAIRNGEAKNLLNFTLDGTAEIRTGETVNGRYDIDVDIDINPFELLAIVDALKPETVGEGEDATTQIKVDMSKDEIVDMIEKMGYISLVVDEVNVEDGSFVKNIVTIYSDFAEGNVIAQLNGEMIIIIPVAIGGGFDLDALVGFISDMIAPPAAEEGATTEADSTMDTVMNVIKGILAATNFNPFEEGFNFDDAAADIAANGLSINMAGLLNAIDQVMDIDGEVALGMSLRDLLPYLWKKSETMNFTIQSVGFGNAVRVDQSELSAVKNDSTPSTALVSEVTDIDIQKVVYGSVNMGLDYKYTLTGTDFNGEEVEFEGYILGYANGTSLDFTKAGEQTVTLYVAASNTGESLIGMLTSMIDLTGYPVFGVYTVDVTFDVLGAESQLEDTAIVGPDNTVEEPYKFSYSALSSSSMKTPFELLRAYRSGVGYTVGFQITYEGANYTFYMDQTAFNANYKILDGNGEDITSTAVNASGDIVLPAGNYKIQLNYEGWTAEANLAVSTIGISAVAADQGAPVLGEQYNYGIVITETLPDGTTETLTATNLSYRIGSTTIANMHTDGVDFDAVGTSDSSNKFLVTLDKLTNSFGAHYVTAAATSTLTESSVSGMRFEFGTVATPDTGLTATTKGTGAFGESLDNIFTITVSGQKYTLHWNGTDWDAVYAGGDNAGQVNDAIDVTVELNWRADKENGFAGGPVTLSAKGYVTNNPVTNGASNMQYIEWKVTAGDMSTTGNFAISPAFISNSEVTVGTSISGDLGRALNTYALADTDNNPETAAVRTSVYMVWEDGAYVAKARAYNSSDKTYSFYDVETVSISLKVIAVDGDSESDVTASIFDANGGFNAAGTYRVELALTTGDAVYNFTTTYTVTAAQA